MNIVAVHKKFELNVENYPDKIAITCGKKKYTYKELNGLANQFAHLLLNRGIGKGSIVGLCMLPSTRLVISILGVLKAGAAYSPLDANYPLERLNLMTSQLQNMPIVVCDSNIVCTQEASDIKTIDFMSLASQLDNFSIENPNVDIGVKDLCYVVFTSGTTGIPKATAIQHSGWLNLLEWLKTEFLLDEHSNNLLVSAFGFDISQRSIMAPLYTGATLHILESSVFDVMMANDLIKKYQVRTLHLAPSTLYLMLDTDMEMGFHDLDSLDYVFIGGEALSSSRVIDWATKPNRRCKLIHQYGVAECTDIASSYEMRLFKQYIDTGVPAGKPVDNTEIHILNSDFSPADVNEIGEICISGAGVGLGYLNNVEMTKKNFLTVNHQDKKLLIYRTGDLGYLRNDDTLMCVGRMDNQVKIRGMRLDLGDVETSLCAIHEVKDAIALAVLDESNNITNLIAFIIKSHNSSFNEKLLRSECILYLPKHMVPTRFIEIKTFPMTPNGKVDRKKLEKIFKQSHIDSVESIL